MSAAYYLSGTAAPTPTEALRGALGAIHARPDWIEEAFWLGSKIPPALPGLPAACPLSAWAPQPGLDALILQTAVHLLVSGQRRALLILQPARTRCAAVLLVGPKAVGVHNLAPLAQIHPFPTFPAGVQPLPTAANALTATEFEPAQIHWVAGAAFPPLDVQAAFPAARPISRANPGLVFQLQGSAKALKKSAPLALLLNQPPALPLRLFLVEKL